MPQGLIIQVVINRPRPDIPRVRIHNAACRLIHKIDMLMRGIQPQTAAINISKIDMDNNKNHNRKISRIYEANEVYVFYTHNHYNDFREYLNYYGGWGEMFGNVTGGGEYSSKDNCNPTPYVPTAYQGFSGA